MRRALPCLLSLFSCAHPTSGSGGGFPELLTRPLPGSLEANKTWSWPERADFDERWKQRQASPATFPVVWGSLFAYQHRWYDSASGAIKSDPVPPWDEVEAKAAEKERGCRVSLPLLDTTRDGQRRLEPLLEGRSRCGGHVWEVVQAGPKALFLRNEDAVAVLNVTSVSEALRVPEDYLADWTYVATLLEPKGNSAELLAEYERRAPVGGCSMDQRPARFAREFAERCHAAGELACFLQVHLRVVGDQFKRVAWSSMGEAQSPTDASALEKTGIDVDRFFRGLVVRVPGERPSELGPSRLARALIETGRREAFERLLVKMIEDERLDTFNRFRALTVYTSLHYRERGTDEAMKAKVARLKLDALSAAWWASLDK